MGCKNSKIVVGMTDFSERAMTMATRNSSTGSSKLRKLERADTEWRICSPVNDFLKKGYQNMTFNEVELELMEMLSEPLGQKYIGQYSKQIQTSESFFCWVEIHEYMAAPATSFRKCMATHIYEKYIRQGARMAIGGLSGAQVVEYQGKMKAAVENNALFEDDFFADIQRMCIADMASNTFTRFKSTEEFRIYHDELKSAYNKVTVDDFEYLELLGSGGFGRVVHALKKSTGHHYAMKIQLKTGLLHDNRDDPTKICLEKEILEKCQHQYIVDMQYCFQTERYAIMVLQLVRGGDLRHGARIKKQKVLTEKQMQLMAAQIALGLHHLHEMGLLYRDLKPANVLLTEEGHIKIADLGLAGGLSEEETKKLLEEEKAKLSTTDDTTTAAEEMANQTQSRMGTAKNLGVMLEGDEDQQEEPEDGIGEGVKKQAKAPRAHFIRKKSTVGTPGYMAPELLEGSVVKRRERPGYNVSVDYWALGITLFELHCGYNPIDGPPAEDAFAAQLELHISMKRDAKLGRRRSTMLKVDKMNQEFEFPSTISKNAKSFLSALLDTNPITRLGCSENGFEEFMQHPFFSDLNWDKVIMGHVESDFKPKVKALQDKKKFKSFDEMMQRFDVREGRDCENWYTVPTAEQQAHFSSWDYIAPATLKAELGLAKDIDDSNTPYKVLQLVGPLDEQ